MKSISCGHLHRRSPRIKIRDLLGSIYISGIKVDLCRVICENKPSYDVTILHFQRRISIGIFYMSHYEKENIEMITYRYRYPLYISLACRGGGIPFAFIFIEEKGRGSFPGIRYFTLKVKLDRRLYDSAEGRHEVTLAGGSWRTLTGNKVVCNPLEQHIG